MAKRLFYNEDKHREEDDNIYSEEQIDSFLEQDELSAEEAAFMKGYMEAIW